jgi:hypothetical protein
MKGDIQEPKDAIAFSRQFNLDIYLPMAGVLRFAVGAGRLTLEGCAWGARAMSTVDGL